MQVASAHDCQPPVGRKLTVPISGPVGLSSRTSIGPFLVRGDPNLEARDAAVEVERLVFRIIAIVDRREIRPAVGAGFHLDVVRLGVEMGRVDLGEGIICCPGTPRRGKNSRYDQRCATKRKNGPGIFHE